jgi:hypothetical protein
MTQCSEKTMHFKHLGSRDVVANFAGGQLSSDAGALLLGQVDDGLRVTERFAALFTDHRDPDSTEHSVLDLLRQRVYGLALGYEDLNDHDELSRDPLLAAVVGKKDPTGEGRVHERDRGRALAGKSTLNRLELTRAVLDEETARYKKIVLDAERAERFFAEAAFGRPQARPRVVVLDLDPTDNPLYGKQEGRHYNAYYREYIYLPLYVFWGGELVLAKLREGCVDAIEGTTKALGWLVPLIRSRWPGVWIIVRADSSFAREETMSWCEANRVDYVFGLAKNRVLERRIVAELAEAKARAAATGQPARVFKELRYQTQKSWTRERRVVAKAEHTAEGSNPRFVVTSLPERGRHSYGARALYEDLYCARGEMENRIKEQQLYLFAGRNSAETLRANQIRVWFSSLAYTLMQGLRREGLVGTSMARARSDTIRLKLLKIGAAVRVTVRRVWVEMSSSYPLQDIFRAVRRRLEGLTRRPAVVALRC